MLVNAFFNLAREGSEYGIACPPNPQILRHLLELLVPSSGQASKIDVLHEGGALVVGYIAKKPAYSTAASVKARKWKSCLRRSWEAKAQVGNQTLP